MAFLMKQIFFQDTVGKTVKALRMIDKTYLVTFSDDTFCYFEEHPNVTNENYIPDNMLTYQNILDWVNIKEDGTVFFDRFVETLILMGIIDEIQLVLDIKPIVDNYVKHLGREKYEKYLSLKQIFEPTAEDFYPIED
jgi:DNA integrity scanning protein DisA with diadenylate cyclase activity